MCVRACGRAHVCVLQHAYAGQKTILWTLLSLSTFMCDLGTKLLLPGLHCNCFACGVSSVALIKALCFPVSDLLWSFM